MRSTDISKAIKIMADVMLHPLTKTFQHPVLPDPETEKDYFEIIKNPQDLATISIRLKNGEYKALQNWLNDVETVWFNSETYNKSEIMNAVTNECRRIFSKICEIHGLFTVKEWSVVIYRQRQRIYTVMGNAPTKIKQHAGSFLPKTFSKQKQVQMTEEELSRFAKAAEMLTSDNDHIEMIRIINELEDNPDLGKTEVYLDLTTLSLGTISALKEYILGALEKKGLKYPE